MRISLAARPLPMCHRLPGAQVSADGLDAGEVLRKQIGVADCDPEALFKEDHKLKQAEGVQDAAVQQRRVVRQRQQRRVLYEFPADVVVDDRLHVRTFFQWVSASFRSAARPARPARSTLPVEVLGSAARNSTTSGTM